VFILTPETIWNPHVLEMRQVPRRVFGRVMIFPRRDAGTGLWLRLIFEMEVLRYLLALVPFLLAAVMYPRYAGAIAQAPLPMLIVIYFFEVKVLRLPPAGAKALASEAEVERGLDLLRVRAVAVLSRIAAGRGRGAEWHGLVNLIQSGYWYTIHLSINYAVARSFWLSRRNHRLNDWRALCAALAALPNAALITTRREP
jgi:hypothetical protein